MTDYGRFMASGTTSVVVTGPSGSGKTTIALALAQRLGWEFGEGDDFHPAANVARMRAGIPLDDEARRPWLARIAEWIGEHEAAGRSCVLTCSALKRTYRDQLREGHESVWFAQLTVAESVLAERVAARPGHYMPSSLVRSQVATLEPLGDDEPGITVSGTDSPDKVVEEILAALARDRGIVVPPPPPPG
jgi:gluconokinase